MNNQPPEKPHIGDGLTLDVVDVWDTIQGEGPYAGRPATFVRLAGCNLQCPICDTEYTSNRVLVAVEELVSRVDHARLVVLTGGEPLRQNIIPFLDLLTGLDIDRQIETNGTLWVSNGPPDLSGSLPKSSGHSLVTSTIVCSPKSPVLNKHLWPWVDAFKYTIRFGEVEDDGLPALALGGCRPARPPKGFSLNQVYLQPVDEKGVEANQRNVEATVESCLKFGYRLCLQIQKIVGLP